MTTRDGRADIAMANTVRLKMEFDAVADQLARVMVSDALSMVSRMQWRVAERTWYGHSLNTVTRGLMGWLEHDGKR